MSRRRFLNPFSGMRHATEGNCVRELERTSAEQLLAMGVTAKQACFNARNGLEPGNLYGRSVASGRPTSWNERAGAYERFADDGERAAYRQRFLERMRRVHGKDHLLDDPERQRAMLASRSISGRYRFADGTERSYTGKEELALLRFLDEAMEWPGSDVQCPAPQNFRYDGDDGRDHFYIPDAWIESLNLIVEVKGEMHQGFRLREAAIERAKDDVLGTSGYNYVKVEDRNYGDLVSAMARAASLSGDPAGA